MTDHLTTMAAAARWLRENHPLFGGLLLRLGVTWDPSCATAYTDGKTVGVNPTAWQAWAAAEQVFVLAHEVMHVALEHPWRTAGCEPRLANVAQDYAINATLANEGFTLPEGCLYEDRFNPRNPATGRREPWGWRRIYEALQQESQQDPGQDGNGGGTPQPGDDKQDGQGGGAPGQQQQQQDGQQDGNGGGAPGQQQDGQQDGNGGGGTPQAGATPPGQITGECRPYPATGAEAEAARAQQQAATVAEASAAHAQGRLPAGFGRILGESRPPRHDWRAVLAGWLEESAPRDFDRSRRDRRFPQVYVYGMGDPAMGPLVVAVDTSGSIDANTLAVFGSEIQEILARVEPERVVVIYCDAAINGEPVEFERGEAVVLEPRGGGGTDFRPVFRYVAEHVPEAVGVVYLTDGLGTFGNDPGIRTLWALTRRTRAPWGESTFLA